MFFVVFVQAIQEFFTTEEWVKNARNEASLADNLCTEASKSLAIAEGRNKKLALKLATMDKDWRSAEDGLRNVEAQTKE